MNPVRDGFFWLAGQGGYGIQTAPAIAQLVADLLTGGKVSQELADWGVREEYYAPSRFELLERNRA
jgi:D-arginine dehydrogenase